MEAEGQGPVLALPRAVRLVPVWELPLPQLRDRTHLVPLLTSPTWSEDVGPAGSGWTLEAGVKLHPSWPLRWRLRDPTLHTQPCSLMALALF